ncbi:uncharacterized protein LOC111346596 [Stylophora pistillata]|uniref:uncharacterized protein LOC111346596 n=1 Tax=Stylophora pistillata TaxID=50429 RepID=UPI000C056867|nr:uncharacterized protein LOC111346596 [Stylophora pistillata]
MLIFCGSFGYLEKELIIALIIPTVVVVLFCCCLLPWWVAKKCKKDRKETVSSSDAQSLSSNHGSLSDGEPRDYVMPGPQPPVPANAVVDNSRKKDKKKNKETAEQKPVDDQYALVDKSKKKKKNEVDNTYAEVDMSKKSKKPKPGEVLYADRGEFHQMKKMPEVSTSPKTLPPIKRPEAYVETQYADITQHLKGNPEDTGAELPKERTTPAVSITATGSKVESSAGNTEATDETQF